MYKTRRKIRLISATKDKIFAKPDTQWVVYLRTCKDVCKEIFVLAVTVLRDKEQLSHQQGTGLKNIENRMENHTVLKNDLI